MPPKKINDIDLVEARDSKEKQLLGFIIGAAEIIRYGKISIEITVHDGKLTNIQQTIDGSTIKRSFNLN